MTHEQFTFWLQGYLDAEPYSSKMATAIKEKLKEVKTSPQWPQWYGNYGYLPVNINPLKPYVTWSSNQLHVGEGSNTLAAHGVEC